MLDRIDEHFNRHGWGFWAVEQRGGGRLIGLCGLKHVALDLPFAPAVEIGWRLTTDCQGKGYAREAAEACLVFGLEIMALERIVAFTTPANAASWGLMRRLGMREAGDFDHPGLPDGHPLKPHVLYSIDRREPKPA